jgi:hypothetical protein
MTTNQWFQAKVRFQKQDEQGVFKKVTETHLMCALSYTDAESRVYEELASTIRGEFSVVGLSPFPVVDIFDVEDAENWYSVIASFQDPSLDSDKIKMIKGRYLVKGNSVSEACDNLSESLKGLLTEHTILSVAISPIIDVFPYVENLDKEISRDSEAYVLAVDGSPAEQGKTYTEGELILESEYNAKVEEEN